MSSRTSRTATPSEIGDARDVYLSSLRVTKPSDSIDWSKLLEGPAVTPSYPFAETQVEPSHTTSSTVNSFLKREPTVKTLHAPPPRATHGPSGGIGTLGQRKRETRYVPTDSDSSGLDEKYDHNPRTRDSSAADRTPSAREPQEVFESSSESISTISSTDLAARVLANVHTIDELEADFRETGGSKKGPAGGAHGHDSEDGLRGGGHQGEPGHQSVGEVTSMGYSDDDFESATEAQVHLEEETREEVSISTVYTVEQDASGEKDAKTGTFQEEEVVTEGEEVITEVEVTAEISRQERSDEGGGDDDDDGSSSEEAKDSDITVVEGSRGHSSNAGPSSVATSQEKSAHSTTLDGLGTRTSTPGGLSTRAGTPSTQQGLTPKMSPSQRLSSHVGVQTDMMTEQSWTFAHSCLNDKDPTPIIPFVIGADALKEMTAHAPSQVALCNIMRAQLSLTRNLISSARQMADSTMQSLNNNYCYTTLKDTKEYIAKRKPRVLTIQEARRKLAKRH